MSPNNIDKQKKKITDQRASKLYGFMALIGLIIIVKVLVTQYGAQGEVLRSRAVALNYDTIRLEAFRGDILTHDNRLLATSVPEYEIRMDFQAGAEATRKDVFFSNVDSLSKCLAAMFGDRSAKEYKDFMISEFNKTSRNRFTLISPRRISHMEMLEASEFPQFKLGMNRGGFIPYQRYRRLLPHGSLARRTIGFINSTGTKLGIEGAFDKQLSGTEGKTLMQKISGSVRVPVADSQNQNPIDGDDVVTTIDADIQDIAETALRQQIIEGQADWGCAILMDVSTGDIRAIANLTRHGEDIYEDFNYAMGQSLEPGSTIKLATLINLLEAGAPLDEVYKTNGGITRIGAATVRDSHDVGTVTLEEAFEQSSNIAFALAANKYYGEKELEYANRIKDMGLGSTLDMQIMGEAAPTIYTPEDRRMWNRTTLTNMAYGYALRLTPLHTLCLYNAIANGGDMVRPRLVTMLKHQNDTIETYPVTYMAEDICSDRTVRTVQQCLENVVNNGTGRMLQNPLYSVAAKTGTAQIAQGRHGYTDANGGRHYLASLAGYFPADNPKYSCIVVLKTYNSPGNRRTYYGAALAGPVFKAIADRVYNTSVDWQPPLKTSTNVVMPIKGGNRESDSLRKAMGVTNRSSADQTITEYSYNLNTLTDTMAIVPDVREMGLRDALFSIERSGLRANISGIGAVREQSPLPGDTVERNTRVELILTTEKKQTK